LPRWRCVPGRSERQTVAFEQAVVEASPLAQLPDLETAETGGVKARAGFIENERMQMAFRFGYVRRRGGRRPADCRGERSLHHGAIVGQRRQPGGQVVAVGRIGYPVRNVGSVK
jgi:hypothetical protein